MKYLIILGVLLSCVLIYLHLSSNSEEHFGIFDTLFGGGNDNSINQINKLTQEIENKLPTGEIKGKFPSTDDLLNTKDSLLSTPMGSVPSSTPMDSVPSSTPMNSVPSSTSMGSVPSSTSMGSVPSSTSMGSVPPSTPMGSVPPSSPMDNVPSSPMDNVPSSPMDSVSNDLDIALNESIDKSKTKQTKQNVIDKSLLDNKIWLKEVLLTEQCPKSNPYVLQGKLPCRKQRAQVKPLIDNGKIIAVYILNNGMGYRNENVKVTALGKGKNFESEAIIYKGKLMRIKIINPGKNYKNDTKIIISEPDADCMMCSSRPY